MDLQKEKRMTEDAKKLFPRRVTTALKLLPPPPQKKTMQNLFICKMAIYINVQTKPFLK